VKFIDEAIITVQSGNGGSGCVSFRREKFIPRGGPDGGDGGKGGDIILETVPKKRTLYHFRYQKHFKAENGRHGQGRNKTGKSGQDLIIEIPPGTIVSDTETGQVIKDFTMSGESYLLAPGGRGGQGNRKFKSATHRTPRFAQPGEKGRSFKLKLDLKLLADVGVMGLPNAGKSSLISVISSARPKTGNYPFTTLTPNLGVVRSDTGEPFVVADIPGLIEGAHQGAGLGIRFLKHIERTRILVHLIDTAEIDPDHPLQAYETVNREIARYSERLATKPQIVTLNKLDLPGTTARAEKFTTALDGIPVCRISAATGSGLDDLKKRINRMLERVMKQAGCHTGHAK